MNWFNNLFAKSTPKPTDGKAHCERLPASVATSETNKGREVTFVIPCGVCGYKTNVTVRIDWGGSILSGSGMDHEFRCQNCNKIFIVGKDSLKPYTDRFV
jgi:transcription elongation factor Elf1